MILLMISMCFVYNVHIVQCIDLPTIILNHMVLPIKSPSQHSVSYYNYVNGDTVDMACIDLNYKCARISINYTNFDSVVDTFSQASPRLVESSNGVGIRTILQEKHNNAQIFCTCSTDNQSATVEVIFYSRNIEEFDEIDRIEINGLTARVYNYYIQSTSVPVHHFETEYKLPAEKNFSLVLEKNRDFILDLKGTCFKKLDDLPRIEEIKLLTKSCSFAIKRSSRGTQRLETSIAAEVSTLPAAFNDDGPKISLSENNILMQLYNFGHESEKWILYEYDSDENIIEICSTLAANSGVQYPNIRKYNGSGFDHKTNNLSYLCDWQLTNEKNYIMFHLNQKRSLTGSSGTTLAMGLTIGFVIIFAGLGIAVYMKKQNQQKQRQRNSLVVTYQNQRTTSTPPHTMPRKFEDLDNGKSIHREVTKSYDEPYTLKKDTYAQAIPKSLRNNSRPDCIPYVEPQDSKIVYGNIASESIYTNGETSDHAEPAYCQPYL